MLNWSRRGFLLAPSGFVFAASVAGDEAVSRSPADGDSMKIIDTHIHIVDTRLPGVPLKQAPDGTAFDADIKTRAEAIRKEMEAAGIEHALGMPCWDAGDDDPLGVSETLELAREVPGLHAIGIADPTRTDPAHLERVEDLLRRKRVKALKAYLGYLHYGPDSPNYRPYYELAARYDIPVVFHTGDTYSHMAKVKYAHPLGVDEVAVDYPSVRFVLAHVGNPWTIDTAEVLYKNNKAERANVWTDLSGLVVGSAEDFAAYRQQGWLKQVVADIRKAFDYAERPDRFLYGSDWPLAPMATYRDFILEVIPEPYHAAVFRDNARALFQL